MDKLLCFGEVHRGLDDQVQAAIAVRFWVLYVVLPPDQLHIILRSQHVRHCIDVVDVVAHDPHSGNIVKFLFRVFAAERDSLAVEFLKNALRRLHAVLKVVYRIVVVFRLEFAVEYLQLGLYLAYR